MRLLYLQAQSLKTWLSNAWVHITPQSSIWQMANLGSLQWMRDAKTWTMEQAMAFISILNQIWCWTKIENAAECKQVGAFAAAAEKNIRPDSKSSLTGKEKVCFKREFNIRSIYNCNISRNDFIAINLMHNYVDHHRYKTKIKWTAVIQSFPVSWWGSESALQSISQSLTCTAMCGCCHARLCLETLGGIWGPVCCPPSAVEYVCSLNQDLIHQSTDAAN